MDLLGQKHTHKNRGSHSDRFKVAMAKSPRQKRNTQKEDDTYQYLKEAMEQQNKGAVYTKAREVLDEEMEHGPGI